MVKELYIINYEGRIYKIFVKDKILYISYEEKVKEIHSKVINYSLEYFDKSIWISLYDDKYSIFIIEIIINGLSEFKTKKHLALTGGDYARIIDSLTMLIKGRDEMNLVFRGWDKLKERAYIFKSNISLSKKLNIISNSTSNNYKNPYISYSYNNEAFILICDDNGKDEYLLYDLIKDSKVLNLSLPNISNISFLKYKNNPIIFYNKNTNKNLTLKYRYLNIGSKTKELEKEESLTLPQNIIRPQISFYRGELYIVWYNNNILNTAKTSDLNKWNINMLNNIEKYNFIKTNVIKVNDNKVEKLRTYMRKSVIEDLFIIQSNYHNENIKMDKLNDMSRSELMEILFYEKKIENKLDNIQNIISLKGEYNKKYIKYLEKINNLQRVIEEKDKIILKLLNIK